MKLRRSILNFILVRESESKLVKSLFIFEFFQGSAIALFFTAAISIFLKQLQAGDIPKVYILAAMLLWGVGFLYHKLEINLSIKRIIYVVVVINTLIIVFFRIFYEFFYLETWYLYLFLAVFNVLYLLNNLEFWGLAAQIFDVRQSKRLFGVISAGDIPAKMIGYFSAYLIIPFIGTENLLIVAATLSSISLFLLNPLFKHSNLKSIQQGGHKLHSTHSIKNMQSAIAGNILIRKIAIVSFFSFAIYLIVNFVFYGYVKAEFKTDKSLVSFFAIFFGVTRLFTLIIKIAFANKMVDKIGLRNALMVSPAILFAICISGIFIINQFELQRFTFYLFGILIVITDVLRSAIQTPVLLAILQPLPVHQRLKGHTIIKGLMDPFAFLVAGIALWLYTSSTIFNFEYLNYFIIVLIVLWAYFTWSVEKDYLKTLLTGIRNRTLNARDLEISDKDTLAYLLEKLTNGSETEAISVLKLINGQAVDKEKFLVAGLNHFSQHVQILALEMIQTNHEITLLPKLKELLYDESQDHIKSEIITAISILDKDFNFNEFITHANTDIAYQATLSSLPILSKTNPEEVEAVLYNQLHFHQNEHKINALKIIGKLGLYAFEHKVIELMYSHDRSIKSAARQAAALLATNYAIIKLVDDYQYEKQDNEIIEALEKIGEKSIVPIQSMLLKSDCQGPKSRKLINLLGKINTTTSKELLEQLLNKFTENSDAIINSLFALNQKTSKSDAEIIDEITKLLNAAIEILFQIKYLEDTNPTLSSALTMELKNIRNKCIYWFYNIYDQETVLKIKTGFTLNTKESIANALELVQMEVHKDFAGLFALVFENSSINDKCLQLEHHYHFQPVSEVALAKNIIYDVNYHFNCWTKSCVFYSINKRNNFLAPEFVKPFTLSKNEVLKNTAEYIFYKATTTSTIK